MLPSNAIRLEECALDESAKVPSSGHVVLKVGFTQQSSLNGRVGFYKQCDPTYPPLLAKFVVGISALYRSTLGKRASEERLVYDSRGNITGTVSIALDGFRPMQANGDTSYDDKRLEALTNPASLSLVEGNVAELLVASWRHKEDDLHPGNLSLAGRLDYDMSWYNILSTIKGNRFVSGLTQSTAAYGTILQEKDLHQFPVLHTTRTHWPAQAPLNGNYRKRYKSEQNFRALNTVTAFRNQVFTSLLKELLSFQRDTLKSRLDVQLGSEKPELETLESSKLEKLLQAVNINNFYDDDGHTTEKSFSDIFLNIAEKEFKSFHNIVSSYKEFREFLINHPAAYLEVRSFYQQENSKFPEEQQYNLEQMDLEYAGLWRRIHRSHVLRTLHKMKSAYKQIDKDIQLSALLSATSDPFSISAYQPPSPTSTPSSSASDDNLNFSSYQLTDSEPKRSGSSLDEIKTIIKELNNALIEYSQGYFSESEATIKTNQHFIEQCGAAFNDALVKIIVAQGGSDSSQSPTFDQIERTDVRKLFEEWQDLLQQLNFEAHLTKQQEQKPSANPIIKRRFIQPQRASSPEESSARILPSNIDNILRDAFSTWLQSKSIDEISTKVNVALEEYSPSCSSDTISSFISFFKPATYTRTRRPEIESIMQRLCQKPDSSATNLIIKILDSKDSWESNSLNTILMKILIKQMLTEETSNFYNTETSAALIAFKAAINRESSDDMLVEHILRIKDNLVDALKQQPSSEANQTAAEPTTSAPQPASTITSSALAF